MIKRKLYENKRAQNSVNILPATIIVIFVVAFSIIFMSTNDANAFWKHLPTFNEGDNIDEDVLEAREMLREANNNYVKTTPYDCRVIQRGVCLNEEDYLSLNNGKPIDSLDYCDTGSYCYNKEEGCLSNIPEDEKIIKCYENIGEKNFRLPNVCENKNPVEPTEKDCVCLDKEGYEYYFVEHKEFYDLRVRIKENSVKDERSFIEFMSNEIYSKSKSPLKNEFGIDYKKDFLEYITICNSGEYCDFRRDGCTDEIVKQTSDDLIDKNSVEEKGFLEKTKDFIFFWRDS